ncbi:MAG TPA: sensor histidine kinase [Vicinamibacterales bacterium]|nr:sensor histidine kinase [Vicinamibacterales bacterium]
MSGTASGRPTRRWSVRARVLLGAALWAIGFFLLSTIVVTLNPRLVPLFAGIHRHAHTAAVLTIICLAAGFALIRAGIARLNAIHPRLLDVRRGTAQRLSGSYPTEVQPLVDDLNALLDHRDQTIRRAIATAGDLAHGLKTPLAILQQEADRAEAAGNVELASTIGDQIDRMRRQVDRHLARGRAAASSATAGARSSVRESTEALARTQARLRGERRLDIRVDVSADHMVRAQREDLDEMLGNLVDNACTWARSRVEIASSIADGAVIITVNDDGRGLPADARKTVLQRGVKADEAAPGSGLGLAIVSDLAELYGGSIALLESALGGLCAEIRLPAA